MKMFQLFTDFYYKAYYICSPKMIYNSTISLLLLYYSLWVFHTSISWWFSLESERQQISSDLQDSSQYSGRPQQCCSLDDLHLSSDFQLL